METWPCSEFYGRQFFLSLTFYKTLRILSIIHTSEEVSWSVEQWIQCQVNTVFNVMLFSLYCIFKHSFWYWIFFILILFIFLITYNWLWNYWYFQLPFWLVIIRKCDTSISSPPQLKLGLLCWLTFNESIIIPRIIFLSLSFFSYTHSLLSLENISLESSFKCMQC